jgi:hypothetical protein
MCPIGAEFKQLSGSAGNCAGSGKVSSIMSAKLLSIMKIEATAVNPD